MRTLAALLVLFTAAVAQGAKALEIYFIDTEGGQSTLVVSPSGQSMLIDTGYAGYGGRDANRIAAVARLSHVKRIDALFLTHYHQDHAGGVPNLLQVLPVAAFYDHGPSADDAKSVEKDYLAAVGKTQRTSVKPGDKIPIKDLNITVVVSAQKHIETPLSGAGQPNPFCEGIPHKEGESGENPQAAGVVVEYGKFRFADLGDILWNEEAALLCPENRVGKLDLFITTHHGTSVSPKAIYALAPRVVVMDNGAKKGGLPESWKMLRAMPGLEDLWQLHFSLTGGKDANSPDTFIANLEEQCEGKYLKVTAEADGAFTVYNSRNKFTKTYPAK